MAEITGSSPVEPEEYIEEQDEEQEQDDEIVLLGERRVSQSAYNVEEYDDDFTDESDSENGGEDGATGSHVNQQEQQQPQPIYTVEDEDGEEDGEESDEYEIEDDDEEGRQFVGDEDDEDDEVEEIDLAQERGLTALLLGDPNALQQNGNAEEADEEYHGAVESPVTNAKKRQLEGAEDDGSDQTTKKIKA